MIRYKDDHHFDHQKLGQSLDDALVRIEKELESLDLTESERVKFLREIETLKARRGVQ